MKGRIGRPTSVYTSVFLTIREYIYCSVLFLPSNERSLYHINYLRIKFYREPSGRCYNKVGMCTVQKCIRVEPSTGSSDVGEKKVSLVALTVLGYKGNNNRTVRVFVRKRQRAFKVHFYILCSTTTPPHSFPLSLSLSFSLSHTHIHTLYIYTYIHGFNSIVYHLR